MPILYCSSGQLNVQVPYNVPTNTPFQMSVVRGTQLSVPEPLPVADAQPGIFTDNFSGSGQGLIFHGANQSLEANAANPAGIGETVVLYCSGLGGVSPAVQAGSPAPNSPLSQTLSPVTVTIGGINAPVSFAGLTPGNVGLYQVNVMVPSGVLAGDAVPVVVSVAGQSSPPSVTMSVH
jgi:uncharacterized protein (TIGR03437 family)